MPACAETLPPPRPGPPAALERAQPPVLQAQPAPAPAPIPAKAAQAAPAPAAPAPTDEAPPAPLPGPTYQIKKNDKLSVIADCYGVRFRDVLALNHIKDPNKIYPGHTITLPEGAVWQERCKAPA